MEKNRILEILFIILSGIPFIAILLFGLAIHYYPRGTTYEGFNFLLSTMSDLGKTIASNGEPNLISRILYSLALSSLAISGLVYYSIIWLFFQERKITKWFSIVGSAIGIIQSGLYFTLAFTPDDTMHNAHIKLIYGAAAFFVAAITIFDITYFLKRDFPKLNTYSYLVMFIVALALMMAVIIAPVFGEEIGMMPRRAGHTLFIFIASIIAGLQGIGAYLYIKRQKNEEIISMKNKEKRKGNYFFESS